MNYYYYNYWFKDEIVNWFMILDKRVGAKAAYWEEAGYIQDEYDG